MKMQYGSRDDLPSQVEMGQPDRDIHRRMEDYYRNIRGYHELVEDQPRDSFIVPPELLLRFLDRNGTTVDVAGGSGINSKILGLSRVKYICADVSYHGLSIAAEKERGMCVQVDVATLPFKDDTVDSVLCSWSLEHMTDPGQVLEEMIRIIRPGGRILIWGPNWDNIFRKDFPQFAHKDMRYIRKERWCIFGKMVRNEFLPFSYDPHMNFDIAALANPERYISGDTDAVHAVLCQETFMLFKQKGMHVVHISDYSEMGKHMRNDPFIRVVRGALEPMLPVLRRLPLLRWFFIRFPIVVEKPG